MNSRESSVRDSFTEQAALCEKFGSAFTAQLIRVFESVLDDRTGTGRAILDWSGPPGGLGDALALRVAGGLHALALSGKCPDLSSIYPPSPRVSDGEMHACLVKVLQEHDAFLLPWLPFAPQTNEVGRSAALYLGLLEITRRTQLPLKLLEIGSSAGINLMLDQYEYAFGGKSFGFPGSPLKLAPTWDGPAPLECKPEVIARRGCDLSPLDVTNPEHRRRLQAYVWPDQRERQQRLATAIDILLRSPPVLERADATQWIRQQITARRAANAATVLMHSLVFSYLPESSKASITGYLEEVGARATDAAPLAWLALELHPGKGAHLTLRLWPGGEEAILAETDAHCRFIKWLPPH